MANGIAELGIDPLEPFLIPELVVIILDNPFMKLVWKLSNLRVSGITNTSRSDFSINTHKHEVNFDFVYHRLSFDSEGVFDGHFLRVIPLAPFSRVGSVRTDLDGWSVAGKFILKETKNGARSVVRINDITLDRQTVKAFRAIQNQMVSPKWLGKLKLFKVFTSYSLMH
jgi:hypothetical protein